MAHQDPLFRTENGNGEQKHVVYEAGGYNNISSKNWLFYYTMLAMEFDWENHRMQQCTKQKKATNITWSQNGLGKGTEAHLLLCQQFLLHDKIIKYSWVPSMKQRGPIHKTVQKIWKYDVTIWNGFWNMKNWRWNSPNIPNKDP